MLLIDGREFKVTEETAFIGNINYNKDSGYNIRFELRFIDGEKKGYINLDTGFEKEKDINLFLNKEYSGLNFDGYPFMYFEVFDTVKFLDSEIECEIRIKINDIKDGKINVNFEVDDDLIKIKYDGSLMVVNNI